MLVVQSYCSLALSKQKFFGDTREPAYNHENEILTSIFHTFYFFFHNQDNSIRRHG